MLLASTTDVEARLGRPLDSDEVPVVEGLLAEASVIVEGYCRRTFTDPVPEAVSIVVSRMAARAMGGDDDLAGVESEQLSAGPFAQTMRFTADASSGGPWLTRVDKTALARFCPRRVVNVPMY